MTTPSRAWSRAESRTNEQQTGTRADATLYDVIAPAAYTVAVEILGDGARAAQAVVVAFREVGTTSQPARQRATQVRVLALVRRRAHLWSTGGPDLGRLACLLAVRYRFDRAEIAAILGLSEELAARQITAGLRAAVA